VSPLAQENHRLRDEIDSLRKQVAQLADENGALTHENVALSADKLLLSYRLDDALRRLYGKSSERLGPEQLALFGVPAEDDDKDEEESAETETVSFKRKKINGHGRNLFHEDLPRKVIEVELPEGERTCCTCASELCRIRDEITERGQLIPSTVIVHQYRRGVWACPKGCEAPKVADLPPGVIDKGKWEPSAYAHVVVSKYFDHLPLHRQVAIFRRHGVEMPKSTVGDMTLCCAELLEPVVKQMRVELLSERLLQSDDTSIQVIFGKGKGSSRKGYLWCYLNAEKVVFDFADRTRDGPLTFLGKWSGSLVVDDYAGYDAVCEGNEIKRAGCWSHARRKFVESLKSQHRRASLAIRIIDRMFWIERAVTRRIAARRGLEDWSVDQGLELRRHVRARRSRAQVEFLRKHLLSWLDDPKVTPKSPLGKAVRYLVRSPSKGQPPKWGRFIAFLDDPELPIHNNSAERALRTVAVGRKNWMFAGSERGARAAATLYSLMGTCRVLDINPQEYVEDVLKRLDIETDVAKLTPWAWKQERENS